MQNGEHCCTESKVAAYEASLPAEQQTAPNALQLRWQKWTTAGGEISTASATGKQTAAAEVAAPTDSAEPQEDWATAVLASAAATQDASDTTRGGMTQNHGLAPRTEMTGAEEEEAGWPRRLASWSART